MGSRGDLHRAVSNKYHYKSRIFFYLPSRFCIVSMKSDIKPGITATVMHISNMMTTRLVGAIGVISIIGMICPYMYQHYQQ